MRISKQLQRKRHQLDFHRSIVTATNTKNGRPRDTPMNDDVRQALADLIDPPHPIICDGLSPTPNEFRNFVKRVISGDLKGYDFGADKLRPRGRRCSLSRICGWRAARAHLRNVPPEGRRDSRRPQAALSIEIAILPNTTHVTLMDRMAVIVPVVNDFLDAKRAKAIKSKDNDRVAAICY